MSRAVTQESKSELKTVGKKFPVELTRYEGELSEFTHKCMLEPVKESIFLALGLALLESLVRMKSKSFLTHSVWKNIFSKLLLVEDLAEVLRLGAVYSNFQDFLQEVKKAERTEGKKMLEAVFNGNPLGVDFLVGVKLLICACVNKDYKLIFSGSLPADVVLKELSEGLNVHYVHITSEGFRLYPAKNIGPLVFVCSSKSQFGVVYHSSAKYLDEKTDAFGVDFRSFPFLYNPSKRFSPKVSVDRDNAVFLFLESLEFLATNLKPLDNLVKAELLKNLSALQGLLPEISSRLQAVYEKATSRCRHNSKEYTPICLQSHCMSCLMDSVLESSSTTVMCPCGVPLDESDIHYLTSEPSTFNQEPVAIRTNPASPIKKIVPKLSIKPVTQSKKTSLSQHIQKLPAISDKILCSACRRHLDKEMTSGVRCHGHSVCLDCRAKRVKIGNEQCPVCGRFYNNEELTILTMRNNSIDLTSSLLKTRGFIDSLTM